MSGIIKELAAHLGFQANRLEQLAVTIAGNCRNSHAGQHLAKAFFHARTIARRAVDLVPGRQFHGQVGMNRAGPRRNQQGHMMSVEDLARLDNYWNIPCAGFHRGLPYSREGE